MLQRVLLCITGNFYLLKGGAFNTTVSIYEDVQEVAYNQDSDNDGNLDQKRAYVSRYAKCGTDGLASFNFNLLKRFTPLTQISLPIGLISMWSGEIADIPQGWVLCNGANGTPNLKDRFIVGAGGAYNVGATGGQSAVALSESQMPSHNHSGTTGNAGNHKHTGSTYSGGSHSHSGTAAGPYSGSGITGGGGFDGGGNSFRNRSISINSGGSHSHALNMNNAGNHNHTLTTNNKGGNAAHENRPPYYALAYIMFRGL